MKIITTTYKNMAQVGGWQRLNGKLYKVVKIISDTSYQVKRLYWYHFEIIRFRVWWIDTVKPYFRKMLKG